MDSFKTPQYLVLIHYPNARCKRRSYGAEYYIIWDGDLYLGQGKTEKEAWKSAYRYVYGH